jgi:hypothetical protein
MISGAAAESASSSANPMTPTENLVDDHEAFLASLHQACRANSTPMEIARIIGRVRNSRRIQAITGRMKQSAEMARLSGKSLAWIYDYEALLRLDPQIQQLLDPPQGQPPLNTRLATILAVLPQQRQLEALHTIQRRKLTHFAALSYVRGLAGKEGRTAHGHKTTSQNERVILTAIRKLTDQLSEHQVSAFESRSLAEWQIAVSQVDQLIAALMKFTKQLGMPGTSTNGYP